MKIGAPGWSRRWTLGSGGFLGEVTLKATDQGSGVLELTDLYVHPQRRRRGWARKLLSVATKYADKHGAYLVLRVLSHGNGDRPSANKLKALYEEFGFAGERLNLTREPHDA